MRMFQLAVSFLLLSLTAPPVHSAEILATVNGSRITDADVELEILQSGLNSEDVTPDMRKAILENLIDREVVVQFLRTQPVRVDNKLIAERIKLIEDTIEQNGDDPQKVLKQLGFTPTKLRARLVDTTMWETFFNKQVDDKALKQYFNNHQQQFDGTEVRGSQIFLKLPKNPTQEDIENAKMKLADYKKQIEAGQITFADAAKKWSQAPSARNGGDLGFSPYRGKNPEVFSHVLFKLEKGKMSEPFQTPFGMHLMTVTDRVPGTYQLEDVRGIVRNRLRKELWDKLRESKRGSARIQYAK